jgi:hypothetical protein
VINLADFLQSVELELALRGVRYDRADLLAFVQAERTLIEDDPDATRWAGEFIKTGAAAVPA